MEHSIPTQMKAVAIQQFGGPDVLHTETLPVPEPREREVLLRVDTAGIGVWDPWVREGHFGSAHFPYVIGNDGAGEVVAVGPGVTRVRVGDRAYGYSMKGGFYAEYVALNEDSVARNPRSVDAKAAGALGADGITALLGLEDQLQLRRGQSLMIIGASGGIGHIALQLAKRIGARVLAVASGKDGVALAERLGADVAIDGKRQNIGEAARSFAAEGLDAALVLAGGEPIDEALKSVKKGGRIAYPHGVEPEPKAPSGSRLLAYDGTPSAAALDRLNELIGDEPFHVELSKVYGLDEAAQAHREVESHHLGKRALRIH